MEDKLPPEQFQRIHRSFIVNVNHVDEVAQNHITVENKILPLSKELRKDLLDRLRLVWDSFDVKINLWWKNIP